MKIYPFALLIAFAASAFAQQQVPVPPELRQIEQFLDQCPASDPAFNQIRADFEILKDGSPVTSFPCTAPFSRISGEQFAPETVLLQTLRLTYYLDRGRTGHLPWTSLRLYDWIKSKVSGVSIRSSATVASCCEVIAGKRYMTYPGAALSPLNRSYIVTLVGQMATIALFAHEARHVDGYPHVSCCGIANGCDQDYDERDLSPYGIQYFIQRAFLTGAVFNINVGCVDPAVYQEFPINVANANLYVERFCNLKPAALPSTLKLGGDCQAGPNPNVSLGGIVNLSNFARTSVAVGGAVSLFGQGLASATEVAPSTPLPTNLGNVTVRVGERLAPLYFVNPGQVNIQVPYDVPPGPTDVVLTSNGNVGFKRRIDVRRAAPAFFETPDGFVIAQNQDGSLITEQNPVRRGNFVTAYLTGIGTLDNPVPSGAVAPTNPLSRPDTSILLFVGGTLRPAQFVGLTPGFVGLAQVNFQVDPLGRTGAQPIGISINGFASSPNARIWIAP